MKLKLFLIYVFFILRIIICLPLIPIIYLWGKAIKASIPDLPEPTKNLDGNFGESYCPKKVLLIGESSISGVGIEDHMEGIPGEIGRILSVHNDTSITWKVVAKSGFKAIDVINQLLPKLANETYNLIVIGLGGNDTFQTTPPWIWRRDMYLLINLIKIKYPSAHVIISAMPPVADFPVFPKLLQSFMGGHTNMLRLSIMDFPILFDKVYYMADKVKMHEWLGDETSNNMEDFFSDGVHPSALTYQLIGRGIAGLVIEKKVFDRIESDCANN